MEMQVAVNAVSACVAMQGTFITGGRERESIAQCLLQMGIEPLAFYAKPTNISLQPAILFCPTPAR